MQRFTLEITDEIGLEAIDAEVHVSGGEISIIVDGELLDARRFERVQDGFLAALDECAAQLGIPWGQW